MVGHKKHIGEMRNTYIILGEGLKWKTALGVLDTSRRIMLKSKKQNMRVWFGFIWFRIGRYKQIAIHPTVYSELPQP